MGKKKKSEPPPPANTDKPRAPGDPQAQKNYSFNKDVGASKDDPGIAKVKLVASKERDIVELILERKKALSGEASTRITNKKLTDLYTALQATGFKHNQIEQAMNNTVQYGGDLIDALDYLCLNTPNDQLPEGFSQTLSHTEDKKRARFEETESWQAETKPPVPAPTLVNRQQPLAQLKKDKGVSGVDGAMKDWILRYAEQSSEEEEDSSEEGGKKVEDKDPNEQYLLLTALLLDSKAQAAEAKKGGDKSKQKQASQKIREYSQEMDRLEAHPKFDPAMKITGIDEEKEKNNTKKVEPPSADRASSAKGSSSKPAGGGEEEEEDLGFSMFAQAEAAAPVEKPKEKKASKKEALDVRSFEYTRAQWTGKHPKQYLIDWCRKYLPKDKPPSYQKLQIRGNLWKCKVTVHRKAEKDLVVCPDIVTENGKEAEYLGCTLALYHLCRGRNVQRLLPPPYRDAWMEWLDAENKEKEETKLEKNKPRDQFISKLLKKLKVTEKKEGGNKKGEKEEEEEDEEEEEGGTWEDLADSDEEEEGSTASDDKVTSRSSQVKGHRSGLSSARMKQVFSERQSSSAYQKILRTRQQLPVYQHRAQIVQMIARESVVVIAGETGSGKSTQIPQFILEEFLQSGQADKCNIVCTQPRRISAMSLANRVSEEMGEAGPGESDSFCGYQIRFEAKKTNNTRLLYCTTGVLLRKLQQDSKVKDITHVIVDEVHERSMDSDFLLIILKSLMRARPELKVILMSATVDSEKFSAYFSHCRVLNIPGRTFPVQVRHLEDVIEHTGYVLDQESRYALRERDLVEEDSTTVTITGKGGQKSSSHLQWTKEDISKIDNSDLDPQQYSHRTRNTVTRLQHNIVNLDLIMELLIYLEQDEEYSLIEGAVLIFMPGLSHIQELHEMLTSDKRFSDDSRYQILALHSVLSSQDQNQAFNVPPPGVRKVVIATNIAETGITIPDVVFVIDSGKVKETRYIEARQMSTLEEVFISKASAKQRQGRAGRVQEGYCFRLFTKNKFDGMKPYSIPEMLRVPLEELCLHIMKGELGDPAEFLAKALDPPGLSSILKAMGLLKEVGACEQGAPTLTPLGHHLALLPLNVRIGKMLLFGAMLGSLEPVAVIAATMTEKSPFAVPIDKRDQADAARRALAVANSDHLTLYKAFTGWQSAKSKGRQQELLYCSKNFLKRTTLWDIENIRRDLIKLVQSIGFDSSSGGATWSLNSKNIAILKSVLTAGLYPSVGRISYEAPVDAAANPQKKVCMVDTPQGIASTHPASVNRFLAANGWLVYHEKVRLSKVYLRDSTMISAFPILLFGGSLAVQHRDQLISVDGWIQFKAFAKTAVIFKELRLLIEDLLKRKLENPSLNIKGERLVEVLLDLIQSEH